MMIEMQPYQTRNKICIVTAAALCDGREAAINIMHFVIQSTCAGTIHHWSGYSIITFLVHRIWFDSTFRK